MYEIDPITANRVIVHGYTLETADSDSRYYAEVNITRLAHEDVDALTTAILETSRRLFAEGTPGTSVEQQFARDLFEYGIVEIAETRTRLFEDARQLTDREFAKRGRRVDDETLETTLHKHVPTSI